MCVVNLNYTYNNYHIMCGVNQDEIYLPLWFIFKYIFIKYIVSRQYEILMDTILF